MLSFASVCSGIEAASAAWEPLGWRCLWLAEIDKAASGVLVHRYPQIPNLGDLTTLPARMRAGKMEPPDVLIGGTPCQPFSVAGLRGGMDDYRGALTMAFVDLAEAIDERRLALGLSPCTILWENVPGVLNHKDNPFGCFLGGLVGEDVPLEPAGKRWTNAGLVSGPERAVGWRILDAQYFGLAQRRRRVFVVASARLGFDPAAILFELESVRRDSPPRREAGQGTTHPTASCLTSSGRGVERTGDTRGQDPVVAVRSDVGLAFGGNNTTGPIDVATARNAHSGPYGCLDFESETFVVEPHCFDARQQDVIQYGDRAGPLDTDGYSQAICFSSKDYGADAMAECAPTLRAGGHTDSHANAGVPPAVCITGDITHTLKAEGFDASEDGTGRGQPIVSFQGRGSNIDLGQDVTGTLSQNCDRASGGAPCVAQAMAVRRLLPVECERLQGFPDGWTAHGTKPQADGPRYKQLGNSMAVPVIRWLGRRIQMEEMFNG